MLKLAFRFYESLYLAIGTSIGKHFFCDYVNVQTRLSDVSDSDIKKLG